jgi:tRNA (guanine-N7-)-methyltransferase
MSLSLSHGKQLDVGRNGIAQDDLPPMDDGRLDPRGWFVDAEGKPKGPDRPIELEIGSGKGTFLVQHAKLYPEVDYLGIEWAKAFWRYAADRARRHGLENVRLLRCDAAVYVKHYVPDATFRQVHIYFPDPWPKKRHNKRRLFCQPNIEHLIRILKPGGRIQIATDFAEYFEVIKELLEANRNRLEPTDFIQPVGAKEGELVGTNYERKYLKQGRPLYKAAVRKI